MSIPSVLYSGTVYLIHLNSPIAHAQHYIGWSRAFKKRLEHHKNGTGAKFLAEAVRRNIAFSVVRKWTNADGHFERKLKNRKNARHLCPVCKPEKIESDRFQRRMTKDGIKRKSRSLNLKRNTVTAKRSPAREIRRASLILQGGVNE